jgi:hypothetical protein
MRGKSWTRRVLLLALVLSVLGLVGQAVAIRLVRAWDESSPETDSGWNDRPRCLSPTRPYLCLLEYRMRASGGLDDWFDDLGLPVAPLD